MFKPFVVMSIDDPRLATFSVDGPDGCWVLCEVDPAGRVARVVACDGGEPEDQLLVRDWSWVPDVLNQERAAIDIAETALAEERARRIGTWRCSACGEGVVPGEVPATSWRWTGERYQHVHQQAGHFYAEFFPWTAEDVAKAIEDECDRHRAKDAEIAKLRGEIEKLRGVRVALADLQVSDEVRDQLAAIEREVREVHAEEIASLRAEVARLRQPPPSPSREEAVERLTNMLLHAFAHGARAFGHPVAVAENEGRAMRGGVSPETLEGITDRADTILRTLGLVAVDPALVERVRNPKHYDGEKLCPTCRARMPEAGDCDYETGEPFGHDTNECARKALLDAVLSQLGGAK